ncbi:MAG: hypothetical protein JNM13_11155 [Hyphomicrobiaceae bacterium]|nr:hypothetical protein [Hyphomicrobiaceae bacterium]
MADFETTWLEPIHKVMRAEGPGPRFVVLPTYRPDIVEQIAAILGLEFVDFRVLEMAPHGWQASRLPLFALYEVIANIGRGLVLHNAEALLATKDKTERVRWLENFAVAQWSWPVVVPLTLYADELPAGSVHVARLRNEDLPAESWLLRMRGGG